MSHNIAMVKYQDRNLNPRVLERVCDKKNQDLRSLGGEGGYLQISIMCSKYMYKYVHIYMYVLIYVYIHIYLCVYN